MRVVVAMVFAVLVLIATAVCGLSGNAAPMSLTKLAQDGGAMAVDAAVVLAVDVSYSMDPDEQALQREGYVQALNSREFMEALKAGANGRIALIYYEWANVGDQKILVPWRLIDGPESAGAVATELAHAPYRRASRTSISGALMFAQPLFDSSGYRPLRRVIDVSGDGANNNGPPVTLVRDEALAKGIIINGLPIMLKKPNVLTMDIEDLDIYYEDCVIGGAGAFVIPIKEREKFTEAIRNKLVQEIASREISAGVVTVASNAPRISCTIGERMWRERWGN